MAIYDHGRDASGTHRISGSGGISQGHGNMVAGKKAPVDVDWGTIRMTDEGFLLQHNSNNSRQYTKESLIKAMADSSKLQEPRRISPAGVFDFEGMTVSDELIKHFSNDIAQSLDKHVADTLLGGTGKGGSLHLDIDFDTGDYVGQSKFSLQGNAGDTHLDTISIFRNGLELTFDECELNLRTMELILRTPVKTTDSSLELRSAPDFDSVNTLIRHEVLILPTSKHINSHNIHTFVPEIGEMINIERIRVYPENKQHISVLSKNYTDAQVVYTKTTKRGIYATLKLFRRRS